MSITLAEEILLWIQQNHLQDTADDKLTKASSQFAQSHPLDAVSAAIGRVQVEIQPGGPLKEYLDSPDITEIVINGKQNVFIECQGALRQIPNPFLGEAGFRYFLRRLLAQVNKTADSRHPLTDGAIAESHLRIHVAIPPASEQPLITIRRHRSTPWRLDDLLAKQFFSNAMLGILRGLLQQKKNILVVGPTSSGKTSLTSALLAELPETERVVILEDTPELRLPNLCSARLKTREDPEGVIPDISLEYLLKNALRMRPDRLVVGEIRGGEALTLLDALATGHRGSISTLHAGSAQQALSRLEGLVWRAAPRWPLEAIQRLITQSIDTILVVEKTDGLRRLTQAVQLKGVESFGYLFSNINPDHIETISKQPAAAFAGRVGHFHRA